MQTQRQQGFAIPVVVMFVCLLAFGIPYLVSGGRDPHADVVLAPRQSPTPTPLDRILTQQAFANLFFTPTSDSFFKILVTGPSATPGAGSPTPARGSSSSTPAVVPPIFAFLTRVSDGGGFFENPTSAPPPTKTPIPNTVTTQPGNMSLRGALGFAEAVPQRREIASSGPRKTSGQASKSLLATTCLSSYDSVKFLICKMSRYRDPADFNCVPSVNNSYRHFVLPA
jgi:hypothetical protein